MCVALDSIFSHMMTVCLLLLPSRAASSCWLSRPDKFIVMPFTNQRMPMRIGPLPLPPFLVEGSLAASRGSAVVAARSNGENWMPLHDFLRQR
jgi:hypothetical protein